MNQNEENPISRFMPYLSLFSLYAFFLLVDFFTDSGKVIFTTLFFLLIAIDSIYSTLQKNRANKKNRFIINSLGVFSFLSYLLRDYLDIPVRPGIAEEATLLPGFRDFLLILIVLSTFLFTVFTAILEVYYQSNRAQTGIGREKMGLIHNTLFNFLILLPFLVGINYLAVQRNYNFDLTSQNKYSLSPASQKILKKIDKEITITAFYPRPLESSKTSSDKKRSYVLSVLRPEIEIFLNQVRAANARIQLKFINSEVETDRLASYENVSNGMIIVRSLRPDVNAGEKPYIEQKINIANKTDLEEMEGKLIQAIVNISTEQKNIYFTASNGERYSAIFQNIPEERILGLLDGLRFMNYKIKGMEYETKWPDFIPEDADVISMIGPTVPLKEPAQQALLEYVGKRKGKLFISIDPYGNEDFSWLLQRSGYQYQKEILSQLEGRHGLIKTNKFAKHPIVKLLSSYRYGVLFPFAGYFTRQKSAPKPEWSSKVLLTSDYSAYPDRNANGKKEKDEIRKQHTLGLIITPCAQPEACGKIIIYSGTAWLTNRFLPPLNNPNTASFINSPFALNHFIWLNQGIIIEDIPRKKQKIESFVLTSAQKKLVWITGMFLYPGFIIAIGSIYVVRKRRKRV